MLTSAILLAYVVYRNARVEPDQRIGTAEHIKAVMGGKKRVIEVSNKLKLYEAGNKIVIPPSPEKSEPDQIRAFNLAQDFLYDMIWHRASEASLTPTGDGTRVHYVVDGVVSEQHGMPTADSEKIIQYLKSIATMDPAEIRRPQSGHMAVDMGSKPMDIEAFTTGSTNGQQMRLRLVQEVVQTDISQLGLPQDLLLAIKAANAQANGILIIAGPPGSGVTSTLYSLIREHDAFMKQIVSVEPVAAVDLENITQYEYGQAEKITEELSNAIRQDPDILMVDRCDTPEAMRMVQEVGSDKLVLLGTKGSDSFNALARWIKGIGAPGAALGPLRVVLSQRLMRKLCPTCREAYRPDGQLLAKMNLPAGKVEQFYRPHTGPLMDEKGKSYMCPTCQGSGYFGRTAVFELLEVTDDLRKLVAHGTSMSQLKAAARKNRMLYLQERALRLAMDGTTSVQEVIRITTEQPKQAAKRPGEKA